MDGIKCSIGVYSNHAESQEGKVCRLGRDKYSRASTSPSEVFRSYLGGGGGSKDEEDEVVEPKCGAGGDLSDV